MINRWPVSRRLTRFLLCDYNVITLNRKDFPYEDSFGSYW